jgi:hypothetical protein
VWSPDIAQPAVALFVFNRPQCTEQSLAAIRQARPSRLLVVADGPRRSRPRDALECVAVRHVCDQIDWPCDVLRNYADANMGCRDRMASGLDWVFSEVEEAIILEDDCIPCPSFFRYCQELLHRHRFDKRVMHISGNRLVGDLGGSPNGYDFTRVPFVWGWASWRRAWRLYDKTMTAWPRLRETNWSRDVTGTHRLALRLSAVLDTVHQGTLNTWDYQWLFACLLNDGLASLPSTNLVSNIGFGAAATHTVRPSRLANLPCNAINFPLSSPADIASDPECDIAAMQLVLGSSLLTDLKLFFVHAYTSAHKRILL